MKCPKCQYIGFDSGDRCRNCGYEFSLAVDEASPLDVTIARDEPAPGRLDDLSLTALDTPLEPREPRGLPERTGRTGHGAGRRPITGTDLPLFIDRAADDQAPLVTAPAVPRPPLSVRRGHPAGRGRGRQPEPEELSLQLGGDEEGARADHDPPPHGELAAASDAAALGKRLLAGAVDLGVLGTIAVTVLYLTLRVAGLEGGGWRLLPLVPLVAFLLLLAGGYFVLFTAAGGQTIGKMIARIRVVAISAEGGAYLRVSFSTALVRALASLASVIPLGAGFIPVFLSEDRRAFHDRIAETRVVSA